jgi:diacylglycerol kinase
MGESFSFPLFDSATGSVMLPWWAAAAILVLAIFAVVLSMLRGGRVILVGGMVAVVFLLLIVTIVWVGAERVVDRERAEERHALVARAQALAAQAAMPGSPLACLDAIAGEAVEAACERALFAGPETIAAAAAYTAARLALLSDGVDYSLRANASYEGALPGLRRALEADRFGFVAQVLTSQYGCSAEHCDAFTLFRENNRIAANLSDRTYDTAVGRHAANWGTKTDRPAPERPVMSSRGTPIPPGFNLPSSASIPPVSIMVPESGAPPAAAPPAHNAPAAEATAPPTPPRRPPAQRPAARPAQPAQPAPNAPVQLVPPTASAPPAPVGNTGSAPRP